MFRLHLEREIAISHQLKYHEGKCKNLHGHNLLIEVDVEARDLIYVGSSKGMVVDFGTVKGIVDELDHCHLNDKFKGLNIDLETQPTAEMLAEYLANAVNERAKNPNITAVRVRVHEAKGQWAEFTLGRTLFSV